MSKSAIKDAVNWFSDAKALRSPLVAVFNANQIQHPAMQVWAIAAAYAIMCESYGLDEHDMINKVQNARKNLRQNNQNEWDAMVNFCKGEFIHGDHYQ